MTASRGRQEFLLISFLLLLALAVFSLDRRMPLGVASGVLYSIVVLFSFWSPRRRLCIVVGGVCTVLMLLGFYFSPSLPAVPLWTALANLVLSAIVMWVPVLFYFEHIKNFDALRLAREQLEDRIRERTKDLLATNRALTIEVEERKQALEALELSQTDLKRSQGETRALADRLLRVQEDERRRISRELHDDINQRLAMLAVEVEMLEQRVPMAPAQTGRALRAIQDRIVELSEDVRHLAYQFHPSLLDDLGLPIALQRLADDVAARAGIQARVIHHGVPEHLSPEIATCLYRVAQEGLANVAKHARASRVEVELTSAGEGLTLAVTDDGVGFDSAGVRGSHASLGLVSMDERIRMVNGTCRIISAPGTGTHVTAWVPVPARAA